MRDGALVSRRSRTAVAASPRDPHGRMNCESCGQPIVMFRVIPLTITPGRERAFIPMEPGFDPDRGIAPSHAATVGSARVCRVLPRGEVPGFGERPLLTHFAVCPARRAAATDARALAAGDAR